jgi:hypothetical protein
MLRNVNRTSSDQRFIRNTANGVPISKDPSNLACKNIVLVRGLGVV